MNVVSFYAPRPEHPFFQDYRPYLALLRESCARFGHNHLVLTDDPMEVGSEDAYPVDLPRSLMKAVTAAQASYLADPAMADVPTLLTGADCVLANDPAQMARDGADIVITVGDFADCRMNTGAIYIPRPARLVPVWAEALAHVGDDWGDDQTSVYLAICKAASQHGLRVAEVSVDPYNLAPDHPGDDCTRGVVLHFRGPRKAWMVDYCHKWLDLGRGVSLTIAPNSTDDEIAANVRINAARGLPVVRVQAPHAGHAVLVGGGPSLASCLVEIAWRKAQGQTVFALNGAAKWLQARGIEPDYGVVLDPRAGNADFVTRGPHWLLASQVHPAVFDAAADLLTTIWHFGSADNPPPLPSGSNVDLIGGGISVGLTAMGLAHAMGYRKLHLYGYDSSDAEGQAHAYAQSETRAESARLEVWCGSRRFITNPAMFAQAKAFEEWANTLTNAGAMMTVHGDGLLPEIARNMQSAMRIGDQAA